ncbi:MAG: DNA translocase FtsK [Bacillota bacterium]
MRPTRRTRRRYGLRYEIAGILLVFFSLVGLWAIFAPEGGGAVNLWLRTVSSFLAGERLGWLVLLYLGGLGVYLILERIRPSPSGPWLGLSIFLLVILSGFDLIKHPSSSSLALAELSHNEDGGGFLGGLLAGLARQAFGRVGAWLMLGAAATIGIVLVTGRPLYELLRAFRRRPRPERTAKTVTAESGEGKEVSPPVQVVPAGQPGVGVEEKPKSPEPPRLRAEETLAQNYVSPSPDLLNPPPPVKPARQPVDQRQQLEETLANFGIQAKVIEVHRGPVITRYDLQPAAGVKVSRIVSLADDLALALAARGLRIEAPIPGKAALGIEVPNKEPRPVSLREVIESKEFAAGGLLSFALGRDIGGEVVVGDLTRMPHLLIAGATGSGKSVCLNTIIMSLLFKAGPDRVKMIMIDPKMVELTAYNGIPHLIAPVVSEVRRAPAALKWAVGEMEQRYRRLMEAGCRDIEAYNRAQTNPEEILPYIVIFIDELADMMMIARVEVEDSICRLAQMARATGIHLVIATQRPSVDVITGLIKANIPSRIAFAVSSVTDSRTILDGAGAERLLGRGDMLYSPVGLLKPRRIQGAMVEEEEVRRVVEFWRAQAGGQPTVKPPEFKEETGSEEEDPAAADELFWQAVQVVVDFKQASASVLQRRLRIGYSRAARLIDLMEAKGFVGPFEGSKPREVKITAEQLAAMRERR